jgi:A/G-specific adenine glycosylase
MDYLNPEIKDDFRDQLISWFEKNKRDMPWRRTHDPYHIWVSEIMLQQTRVDQATDYYLRFIDAFPTVHHLADADQEKVLKLWEGLGYYSRARNLHKGAQFVSRELKGEIPPNRADLEKIKGIGPYTSAAVSSIAFNQPHAVVDGNVIRVITRLMGIDEDIRKTAVKNDVQEISDELLDPESPGAYNEAMMELGATRCHPTKPDCENCPVQLYCEANKMVKTDEIPYKSKAKKRPHKEIGIAIIMNEKGEYLISKRPEDVMLGGLWEFPGGKREKKEPIEDTVLRESLEELGVEISIDHPLNPVKHIYSHFSVTLFPYICSITKGNPKPKSSDELRWVTRSQLHDLPFPKANIKIFEQLDSPRLL